MVMDNTTRVMVSAHLQKQLEDKERRIAELERLLRKVPDHITMTIRYRRGELSWANTMNEFNQDLEAAIPGVFNGGLEE
jgi:hypothetical protein